MRKIVDSNQLQELALRDYLSRSEHNYAVLTDYAAMEAYKGDVLTGIFKSMEILSDYPSQVLVLKNTRSISCLCGRGSGLQKRFIDEKQTRNFQKYIGMLEEAKSGNTSVQSQLLLKGKKTTEHLNSILGDSEATRRAYQVFIDTYTKDERQLLRARQPYTSDMADKLAQTILLIASKLFKNHPDIVSRPTFESLPNTYIFRFALCIYLLALDWGVAGGIRDVSDSKLRNDVIDMSFAAYATYFDGILTADRKVNRVYQQARNVLQDLFGCHIYGD